MATMHRGSGWTFSVSGSSDFGRTVGYAVGTFSCSPYLCRYIHSTFLTFFIGVFLISSLLFLCASVWENTLQELQIPDSHIEWYLLDQMILFRSMIRLSKTSYNNNNNTYNNNKNIVLQNNKNEVLSHCSLCVLVHIFNAYFVFRLIIVV